MSAVVKPSRPASNPGADFLNSLTLNRKVVKIEKNGSEVLMQELSGRQLQQFAKMNDPDAQKTFGVEDMCKVVQMSAINEDGSPLFTPEQAEQLADKSVDVLRVLFLSALEVSGLSADEVEKAGKN